MFGRGFSPQRVAEEKRGFERTGFRFEISN
jgi:hypothetical protein